jgi:hypothetical protein
LNNHLALSIACVYRCWGMWKTDHNIRLISLYVLISYILVIIPLIFSSNDL